MTRPMPGPPERTSHDRHSAAGFIRSDCPWCASFRADESKRLTDAECEREWEAFEQVESYGLLCIEMGDKRMTPSRFEREANESDTWHRFATRPHALEVQE